LFCVLFLRIRSNDIKGISNEDARRIIFIDTLNGIDTAVNAVEENEIRTNSNEIPQQADIFVLDAIRRVFTGRILNFMQESLVDIDLLRAMSSLDAVTQEFDFRRQNH
jgi:hypothetical protein